MVYGELKDVDLNRSRSLPHVFSSYSSPSQESKPKKASSLAKILSWFSFKGRTQNADQKKKRTKNRALRNLITKLVKKGKRRGQVFKTSDTQFLCVPSLYLYERFSKSISSCRLNRSFISRRTTSDANVLYKCTYDKARQNNVIPLKDKIGCYYAVVVDGKQYSLSDFFVKATNDDGIKSIPQRKILTSAQAPMQQYVAGSSGIGEMTKDVKTNYDTLQKNSYKSQISETKEIISNSTSSRVKKFHRKEDEDNIKVKPDLASKEIISKSTSSRVRKSYRKEDEDNIEVKPDLAGRPDIALFSRCKYSMVQSVGKKPMQRSMISSEKQSWNTNDQFMYGEPNTRENVIVQNIIENSNFRDISTSIGEQSSCSVMKKNSVHRTNLARMGTNLEPAHLEKLKMFIRTHRIDSGKLEFKERLALQWVESKGDRIPSALETRRAREFQDHTTYNAFFESAPTPMRLEPPMSRFVPHFPPNKKFVYEVKPRREPSICRLPELRERYQEPQIVMSFSQETIPQDSLFVPLTGPKPAQETVKMRSNLWDLGKQKQRDCNVAGTTEKNESWNFKMSK